MGVGISWANKMEKAQCDISVGFPKSSHIFVLAEISNKFPLLCWHYALCFPAPIMLKIMLA